MQYNKIADHTTKSSCVAFYLGPHGAVPQTKYAYLRARLLIIPQNIFKLANLDAKVAFAALDIGHTIGYITCNIATIHGVNY